MSSCQPSLKDSPVSVATWSFADRYSHVVSSAAEPLVNPDVRGFGLAAASMTCSNTPCHRMLSQAAGDGKQTLFSTRRAREAATELTLTREYL
jgi:hypothetical protein